MLDALTGIELRVDSVDGGGATVTVDGGPFAAPVAAHHPDATTPQDRAAPTAARRPPRVPEAKGGVIRLTKTRRFVVEVEGAGPMLATYHGRSLGRRSRAGRWQVRRAAVRRGTIRLIAWRRQGGQPVLMTLRIRQGVVTFSIDS